MVVFSFSISEKSYGTGFFYFTYFLWDKGPTEGPSKKKKLFKQLQKDSYSFDCHHIEGPPNSDYGPEDNFLICGLFLGICPCIFGSAANFCQYRLSLRLIFDVFFSCSVISLNCLIKRPDKICLSACTNQTSKSFCHRFVISPFSLHLSIRYKKMGRDIRLPVPTYQSTSAHIAGTPQLPLWSVLGAIFFLITRRPPTLPLQM